MLNGFPARDHVHLINIITHIVLMISLMISNLEKTRTVISS